MWETIQSLIDSGNLWLVLIVIGLAALAVKLGLLRIHSDKVSISRDASEQERIIMRNQVDLAKYECEAFEAQIPRFEGYDEYRSKYIVEKVYDEIIQWIMFNHISESKNYVQMKQNKVWKIVLKHLVNKDFAENEEFKQSVYENIEEVIHKLVETRKEYSKF